MIEDMTLAGLAPRIQEVYLAAAKLSSRRPAAAANGRT
jgi:hypothetical protein